MVEYFMAWYSGNKFERQLYLFRAFGHYGTFFWIMVLCNTAVPLLFFFKRIRTNIRWLFGISILINIGMWLERFVIVVGSMAQDFIPYQWGFYRPTWVDGGITFASFCLFFLLFILFAKFLPSVSMTEIKEELLPPLRRRKETPIGG
jgi:molybdopterin-containing oxidoreductase family membrane subunit